MYKIHIVFFLCFFMFFSAMADDVEIPLVSVGNVDYDIVYVRYPAESPNNIYVKIPQGEDNYTIEFGADLMLLHPDGTEDVLVDCSNLSCSVMDPTISFDGKTVYYSRIEKVGALIASWIYKIKLDSDEKQEIRLTFDDGFDSNLYAANGDVFDNDQKSKALIRDNAPIPLADGRLLFTSNRAGLVAFSHGDANPEKTGGLQQLYTMIDHDGQLNTKIKASITRLETGTLHLAQHPIQLKDGRILFSSWQDVATKYHYAMTSLFTVHPDGSNLQQFTEPHDHHKNLDHFITQLPDESIITANYYPSFDYGYGVLFRYELDPEGPDFLRGKMTQRYDYETGGFFPSVSYREFDRKGGYVITPHTTSNDIPAPNKSGKYSMPAVTSNSELLVAYSTGYVNHFNAVCAKSDKCDKLYSGIYLVKSRSDLAQDKGNLWVSDVTNPKQLVKIKDAPLYNEIWPKPVLSYKDIYGIDKPNDVEDKDYSVLKRAATLLPGEATAIVGTSSMYNREGLNESELGGPFGSTKREIDPGNWTIQGAEAGVFENSDIHAVRIVSTPPKPFTKPISKFTAADRERHTSLEGYSNRLYDRLVDRFGTLHNERWEILGEFPLTYKDSEIYQKDLQGNPDSSWAAKVPADTPFLIQTLDKNGMTIISELTWRGLKSGEVRTDCGGCHAHSVEGLEFESTYAAAGLGVNDLGLNYLKPSVSGNDTKINSLKNGLWDLTTGYTPVLTNNGISYESGNIYGVEYRKHVQSILKNKCVDCHNESSNLNLSESEGGAEAYLALTNNISSSGKRYKVPQRSKYIRVPQARESLLTWVVWGERLDGRTNEMRNDDIDYTDDIHNAHLSLNLTDLEKRTIARWIDLGGPIDFPQTDGMGYTDDNQLPVINIAKSEIQTQQKVNRISRFVNTKAANGSISRQQKTYQSRHVGVIDVHSGINFDKWKAYFVPVEQLANKASFEIQPQRSASKLNESITDKRLRTYNLVPSQGEATDYIFMVEVEDLVGNKNVASERISFN